MDALAGAIDSVSDLLLAEGVHQVIQGNPTRSSASLEALARGEAPPRDFDVVETPRAGVGVAHHLLALQTQTHALPAAFATLDDADPFLADWAGETLGDLAAVDVRVHWRDETGELLQSEALTAADLGLTPLELVALVRPEDDDPGRSWKRWLAGGRTPPAGVPADALPEADLGRDPAAPAGQRCGEDLVELAAGLRAVFQRSRPLEVEDVVGDAALESAPQLAVLASDDLRAGVRAALAQAVAELTPLVAPGAEPPASQLRDALRARVRYHLPSALPEPGAADDEAARRELSDQVRSVLAEIDGRLRADDAAGDAAEGLRALLGLPFLVGTTVTADPAELQHLFAVGLLPGTEQQAQQAAARGWLEEAAVVQPGAAALDELLLSAELLGGGASTFAVGQSPRVGAETWVGLPQDPAPDGGRASLVALAVGTLDWAAGPVTGRLLDAWDEVLPASHRDTGLAFQYDRPSQEPPQSILLALPAAAGATWQLPALERVVLEAFDLARLRLVDLEDLPALRQLLPATALPFNVRTSPGATPHAASFDPRFPS